MTNENGSGRMDRIEATLEKLAFLQGEIAEQHDADFKKLMTWQVLMQDKMDAFGKRMEAYETWRQADDRLYLERQRAMDEKTDKRIADLVAAIMTLVEKR